MSDTINDLIFGIVYTKFHDKLGPQPYFWTPSDISEDIRLQTCIKSITLLAGEEDTIPKSLSIVPFPSFNLKGMVKYVQWEDATKRGGNQLCAIILLFDEVDDIIFYKYIEEFEDIFEEIGSQLYKLAKLEEEKQAVKENITSLCRKVQSTLRHLRDQEVCIQDTQEFPTAHEETPEQFEYIYKIIVCGDPGVGKTSSILRFTDNAFRRSYLPTIGVNVSKKKIVHDSTALQFIIWDIAGQMKFKQFRAPFYEGANGILLVFDRTNPESLATISKWYKDIATHLKDTEIKGFLLGNKSDLKDKTKVSTLEASALAYELNLEYIETSALTGENINEVFETLGEMLLPKEKQSYDISQTSF